MAAGCDPDIRDSALTRLLPHVNNSLQTQPCTSTDGATATYGVGVTLHLTCT